MSTLYLGDTQILPDTHFGTGTVNTTNFSTITGSGVYYRVVNGTCFVYINRLTPKTTAGGLEMCSGLPTCKLYTYSLAASGLSGFCGVCEIYENTGSIIYQQANQNQASACFSYPCE